MEVLRHYVDITFALLTAIIALYFRWDKAKREAFEKANPRFASFIGALAGFLPFFPVIIGGIKGVITGQHPRATGTPAPYSDVPAAPWQESPAQPTSEVDSGTQETQ